MRYAAICIADYVEATEGMPSDLDRLYFRVLLKMYAREGGLPDDDRENARIFGYDIRVYRRLKAKLLAWPDTLFVENGHIFSARANKEIAAALKRIDSARRPGLGGTFELDGSQRRVEVGPTSSPISPRVRRQNSALATPPVPTAAESPIAQVTSSPAGLNAETGGPEIDELLNKLRCAAVVALDPDAPGLLNPKEPLSWLEGGTDLERDVIPVLAAVSDRVAPYSVRSWRYFTAEVLDAKARRERGTVPAEPPTGSRGFRRMRELLNKNLELGDG